MASSWVPRQVENRWFTKLISQIENTDDVIKWYTLIRIWFVFCMSCTSYAFQANDFSIDMNEPSRMNQENQEKQSAWQFIFWIKMLQNWQQFKVEASLVFRGLGIRCFDCPRTVKLVIGADNEGELTIHEGLGLKLWIWLSRLGISLERYYSE